ncbi:odorant receptor 131-2-like [Hoplias malabaricus]|uniref:odorant receptor 131-2-like n=1 Tax=Hoplias malabaricus TaxID=27720 RepID=UPI003461AF3D
MQSLQVNVTSSSNLVMNFSKPLLLVKVLVVQVLVGIFLYVNCLMIFSFLKKDMFREDTRYILFAQTLFVDSTLMILSNMLMVASSYQYCINVFCCLIICTVVSVLNSCTPLTLVAMCLERYVAICMPLRHADISTSRTRLFGFLVIWGISSMPALFTFIAYLTVVQSGTLSYYTICSVEVALGEEWQAQTRVIILQILFLLITIIIVFTYFKIMTAARAASLENKKSANKCLRTVLLHAFQLFLCIMRFLTPYIEMAFWKADAAVLYNLKYCNFIIFLIAPRCLSPLIYGVRDEKFFLVLKHYAMCGLSFSQLWSPTCLSMMCVIG